MKQRDEYRQRQCWIDIFEGDQFMGKMRRIFGPAELKKPKARSVIVGPKAHVLLEVRRGAKPTVLRLDANRLIPSLAATVRGARIAKVTVMASPGAKSRRAGS